MATGAALEQPSTPPCAGEANLARLCRLLAEFEEANEIEGYTAHGWQVWPLLRILFAFSFWESLDSIPQPAATAAANPFVRIYDRAVFYLKPALDLLRWRLGFILGRPAPWVPCDVLICASGQRYQMLGGKWVHYATGPFADLVEKSGRTCRIWQWGPQPSPAERESVDVSVPVTVRQRIAGFAGKARGERGQPDWYQAFDDFHLAHTGARLPWGAIDTSIRLIADTARPFQSWLRRARPRLIALDCWTNWQMFAVSLAAHRLEIPVVEMQHGVQEFGHSSYHWWRRAPVQGWTSMPDVFWVWGDRAKELYRTNRIAQRAVTGGNPWLARWVSGQDEAVHDAVSAVRKQVAGRGRSVLVTLGYATEELQYVKAAIERSPEDWIWLVRTHPTIAVTASEVADTLRTENRTVQVHAPSDIPLYALLGAVDLHVTSYSTCANEALAFAKPTVLFGWPALELFQDLIDDCVMHFADRPEAFPAAAEAALAIDPEKLREAARPLFMLDEQAMQSALEDVLSVCDNQGG